MPEQIWLLCSVAIGITGFIVGMWIFVRISDAREKRAASSDA
ncbi:MAG TPA: hypothetical protein VJM14_00175 [Burkholderiales bacterium]|jgi:hypothetical protein|nr:hypothetical protein [Burkholderiales bacterium]